MKQMVPLNKQSKKAKRAYYSSRRGSWHEVDPVTRMIPSGKQYSRAKERKRLREDL